MKSFIQYIFPQIFNYLYIIMTVLVMGHFRGLEVLQSVNLTKEIIQSNPSPFFITVALSIDFTILGSSYVLGFLIGLVEGILLVLSYPIVNYFQPTIYLFGLRTHHAIFPLYLLINILYSML